MQLENPYFNINEINALTDVFSTKLTTETYVILYLFLLAYWLRWFTKNFSVGGLVVF